MTDFHTSMIQPMHTGKRSLIAIFFVLLLFYIIMQVELLSSLYWTNDFNLNLKEVLALTFSQAQNLLVSAAIAMLFLVFRSNNILRSIYLIFLSIYLFYLVCDVIYYSTFFDHLQFDNSGEQKIAPGLLLDSVISSLNITFYWNLLLWTLSTFFLGTVILVKKTPVPRIYEWAFRHRTKIVFLLLLLIIFGFLAGNRSRNYVSHPIVSLVNSLVFPKEQSDDRLVYNPDLDIFPLLYGQPSHDSLTEKGVLEFAAIQNKKVRQPDIIYFIIESVGALNILNEQTLTKELTPNLYAYQSHMAVFPRVYNYFPGTVRSHLPIMTGGYSYTWGAGVNDNYRYMGPTIASALDDAGYSTSVYSTQYLDFGNMIRIYQNMPLDYLFLPENQGADYNAKYKLNSWGISDLVVAEKMLSWIDTIPTPYFAEFINVSSHHPYDIPNDFEAPFPTDNGLDKYRNTIYLLDNIVGRTVEFLKKKGTLDNTLIVVTGDHGQAFGLRHSSNFMHRAFLYEENIRNFFLVIDFRFGKGPVISQKAASVADVMPTILSLVDIDSVDVLGQNLFDINYQQKINYFHKIVSPGQWGLLDGEWKFTINKTGEKPELYNLREDSLELINLADRYPDRVKLYHSLCNNWYLKTDENFLSRLEGRKVELPRNEISIAGPKLVKFGVLEGEEFIERQEFHVGENVVFKTWNTAYDIEKTLEWLVIAPSGEKYKDIIIYEPDWTITWWTSHLDLKNEYGSWEFLLFDGPSLLLKSTFTVVD